jgi:hypothetical protein
VITATGIASADIRSTNGHDATPGALPIAEPNEHVSFMFMQTFGSGSIDAATDGVPTLVLVADHLAGQTLYFSDRPERIVGMVPTEEFLGNGTSSSGPGFA